MVPHEALIKALRSLKFTFKRQADRVEIYKQSGSTRRVEIRRRDLHDEMYSRVLLRQAGMAPDAIESFIAEAKVTRH